MPPSPVHRLPRVVTDTGVSPCLPQDYEVYFSTRGNRNQNSTERHQAVGASQSHRWDLLAMYSPWFQDTFPFPVPPVL